MSKPAHPNLPPQIGRLLKPGLRFGQAVYSAAQMHEFADAYAREAVSAERERCAAICDTISRQYKDDSHGHAAERAANAIRLDQP